MIKVTSEMTTEELSALIPEGTTHFRFTPDGSSDSMKPSAVKNLNDIVGTVGAIEFGKGVKNFTPVQVEEPEKTAAKKAEKPAETEEQKAEREAKEAEKAIRRAKLELIDSMLCPVGFETPPTKEEYREAKGEGADINLAEFKHDTQEIVDAIIKADYEPKRDDEDDTKHRFRIMKNIQARKFNLSRGDRVGGYKARERDVSVASLTPNKIIAYFNDEDCVAKLSDEQKATILSRLSK